MDSAAFSLMMAIAAYLGRENPDFIYPEILWSFVALLGFNLINFTVLSKRIPAFTRARLAVLANTALVTGVIHYSGGPYSYFWVMYLLPIFTAALALEGGGIFTTVFGIFALLGFFYRDSFRMGLWVEILEWAIKVLTLLTAAGVMVRVAFNERRLARKLMAEREKAAQEHLAAREKIQHMDRLATLGTLAASLTHELKGPLTSIIGFTDLALEGPSTRDSLGESMRYIDKAARRCKTVIDDMLSFARHQQGDRKVADLNALIKECVRLKNSDLQGSEIQLDEEYAENLPHISVNPAEFQQVIFNLLTNAEQAVRVNREGGGLIRIRTQDAARSVLVSVEDNGPGIPENNLDKIWEPFFTTKPAGVGTGLGLPICRQIVENHSGRIWVEPGSESGAAFRLEFPKSPAVQ